MQCFIMFVFGIVAFHVGNGVGGTEACQGVDMTVGIIAGQITVCLLYTSDAADD